MRILHTADWHLGKTLEGRSRLSEQAEVLEELNTIVKEENIDAVIMAGDVFDTVNPPALAEQLYYESLSALSDGGKRPVVVIAGNHDNPDRLAAASPLTNERGIHLIGYPRTEPVHIEVPSADELLAVAALAYPSEARLNEVLSDTFEEKLLRDHYDVKIREAFAHMCGLCRDDAVKIAASHIYVAGEIRPIQSVRLKSGALTQLPLTACRLMRLTWLSAISTVRKRSSAPRRLPVIQALRSHTAFQKPVMPNR
ncbi:exonuclease subunit SbcD [Bacillus amyloliquefaciens]|nr:exonuclease subunit SbcD [Bacillus amyloliquefaciens]